MMAHFCKFLRRHIKLSVPNLKKRAHRKGWLKSGVSYLFIQVFAELF